MGPETSSQYKGYANLKRDFTVSAQSTFERPLNMFWKSNFWKVRIECSEIEVASRCKISKTFSMYPDQGWSHSHKTHSHTFPDFNLTSIFSSIRNQKLEVATKLWERLTARGRPWEVTRHWARPSSRGHVSVRNTCQGVRHVWTALWRLLHQKGLPLSSGPSLVFNELENTTVIVSFLQHFL